MHDQLNDRSNRLLGHGIAVAIIVLASVNGIFTFSGARLFVDVWYYAVLFAVAVQFAIAVSLLALPSVHGIGRLVLLMVYMAALSLSTASAYAFVYTAGTEGRLDLARGLNTADRAGIGSTLGQVLRNERLALDHGENELERLRRAADEEAGVGLRSGRGPGKGPEYFRKLEAVEAAADQLELDRQRLAALQSEFDAIAMALQENHAGDTRNQLLPLVSRLQSLTSVAESRQLVRDLIQETLGTRRNPVETALSTIINRADWDLALLISLVWAGIFDLLALFLGIVRYYLLRPGESVLNSIHGAAAALWVFFLRLASLRRHAEHQLSRDQEAAARNTPLNSIETQNFATYLVAAGSGDSDDPATAHATIRQLVRLIEPLNLVDRPDSVGVRHAAVEHEPTLRNLLAFMLRHGVFSNDVEQRCFVLNNGGELAHKVMVMVRLGLNAETVEGARRLLLNPDAASP